jgi:hypothetical protein
MTGACIWTQLDNLWVWALETEEGAPLVTLPLYGASMTVAFKKGVNISDLDIKQSEPWWTVSRGALPP